MVDFKQSMSVSKNYMKDGSESWQILKEEYDIYLGSTNDIQKIPKIIHQVWIGGKMPDKEKRLCDEWKDECKKQGWEYMFWGNEEVKQYEIRNNNIFERTKSVGQKSDIIRLQILEDYGGVYLDTDFKYIKMFDDKMLTLDFFAGLTYDKKPVIMNSLIGSSGGNELICHLNEIEEISYHNAMEVIRTTGPYYLTDKYFKSEMGNKCIFPVTYFFPFSNKPHDKVKGNNYQNYIKGETNCVHLWNCSWMVK